MKKVSKSVFLNSVTCLTLGWMMRSGEIEEIAPAPTLSENFRKEQGIEIGKRARSIFPKGILVNEMNLASAAKRTTDLIADPQTSVVFEGTFTVNNFVAKADILRRNGDSWQLIEVKSSVKDKPEFIDDMAYTLLIASLCNVPISKVSLMIVSKDYRLGMNNDKLFVEIDHTDDAQNMASIFESVRQQIEEETQSQVKPSPALRFECRNCVAFKQCIGEGVNNPLFDIPRLSQRKFIELNQQDITCVENIPDVYGLTENQSRVRWCVKTKQVFVGENLKSELEAIEFPAYYLDFETVMTALPLYPDIAPYTQIPTQYSIHKCSKVGNVIDHVDFLSDPSHDCRRKLAEHLIRDLGNKGSIITYSNFEKTILNSLSKLYPDISKELSLIINRIIDLNAIISKNFYHPHFHGKTSIKVTLPVLVPQLTYDDLEIRDGNTAVATFAYIASGKITNEEAKLAITNLLKYCERDTLAMVKLHSRLREYT